MNELTDPIAEIRNLLAVASQRASESMQVAKNLLTAGFEGPALVWAVRSVEIFMKEFLVAPTFFDGGGAEAWFKALKKAGRTFGASNWKKAMGIVEREYGPIDPMVTEDGVDAYSAWETQFVRLRGAVVHGELVTVPAEQAQLAIAYGEQMIQQLKMRMIVSEQHPLAGAFLEILTAAQKAFLADQSETPSTGSGTDDP